MGENELRVVVEQPFDLVGSLLVPVAAILVSSLIAIWVARGERHAANRAFEAKAAVEVVRALHALMEAAQTKSLAAVNERSLVVATELNVLVAALPRGDLAVPKFVGLVMSRSIRGGDVRRIESTSAWLIAILDGWLRGDVKTKALAESMPDDPAGEWTDKVDPSDWPKLIAGKLVL